MRIAIIGAGAMGGALAEGLLKGNIFLPKDVTIANPHEDKLKRFAEIGASITTENQAAIIGADIVVIAVKPQTVRQVLEEIKPSFDPEAPSARQHGCQHRQYADTTVVGKRQSYHLPSDTQHGDSTKKLDDIHCANRRHGRANSDDGADFRRPRQDLHHRRGAP